MSTNTLMGSRPANTKAVRVELGLGEWKDSPYFAPGMEEDTENMRAYPIGAALIGTIAEIVTFEKEDLDRNGNKRRDYLLCETLEGEKFRVQAPGQLVGIARKIGTGVAVEIKYLGKEKVEGRPQPLHQFEVNRLETLN